jgi:hypothetical protein
MKEIFLPIFLLTDKMAKPEEPKEQKYRERSMRRKTNRLITFFISSLLFFSISNAQTSKISVEGKPKKSTSEIVGVRDANGRFCAAIKVISDMDGFK